MFSVKYFEMSHSPFSLSPENCWDPIVHSAISALLAIDLVSDQVL